MVVFNNRRFNVLLFMVILLLGAGTVFYHFVESYSWIDSFYLAGMTITTVGYGDFMPQTNAGKIFTVIYVLLGLGVVLAFVNMIASQRIKRRQYEKAEQKKEIDKLEKKVKKLKKKK